MPNMKNSSTRPPKPRSGIDRISGLVRQAVLIGAASAVLWPVTAGADPVEDFYKGRQVTVIISGSAGSTYDIGTRLIAKYMSKYIPGNPTMVAKAMPGGGHIPAANFLYNAADQDGSVFGSVGETIPLAPLLNPEHAKFDAAKFHWLGNPANTTTTIIVWHTKGVKTIADAQQKEVIVGASGVASPSAQVPQILNNVLGTKFKIITGFPGTGIELAMERGEVDARGSTSLTRLKSIRRDWWEQKKAYPLVQIGLKKDNDFPDVPLLIDVARNEAERQIFRFISSSALIGRPIVAPPGVPADRVAALRKAFEMTMKDPDYLAEADKLKLELDPVTWQELQSAVEEISKTPPQIVELIKSAHKDKTFNCKDIMKDPKLCEGSGSE